jgi:hypothetical protein
MPWLKYYDEERARYGEVPGANKLVTREEATVALRKLCRHFKVPPLRGVKFTSGRNRSTYNPNTHVITLNGDWAGWRTLAHEFAHAWHHHRKDAQIRKIRTYAISFEERQKVEKIRGQRWHGKHHARLIDRAFAYIQKQDWESGALRKKQEQKAVETEAREEAKKVEKNSRQVKIDKRRQQVERLERKIKALTTRLKKAKRSLGALERAEKKAQAVVADAKVVLDAAVFGGHPVAIAHPEAAFQSASEGLGV